MSVEILSEYSVIEDAKTQFLNWWATLWEGHEHVMPCPCDGSKEDLDALGYCSYELGFPDEEDGYRLTSIIWGNVIHAHSNLQWGSNGDELVLFAPEGTQYLLYPRIRVLEIIGSSGNQHVEFDELTQRVFVEMTRSGFEVSDLPSLRCLFEGIEQDDPQAGLLAGFEFIKGELKNK